MTRRRFTTASTCIAITTVAVAATCALIGGCHRGPASVKVGEERITVEDVLAEVARMQAEPNSAPGIGTQPDDSRARALASLHRLVVRSVVTAAPMTEREAEILGYHEARRLLQQCLAARTKQIAAERFDLEQEMRARFDADPSRYTLPESFRLQMIFIPSDEAGGEQLALDLLASLREDPDRFDELARQYSRSATATDGGRTMPMPGTAVHPEMRAAIERHHDSQEAFLVTLDRGWYLTRTLDYWPAPAADYASALPHIRAAVSREIVAELHGELRKQASQEHEIRVLDDALAAPELPPSTAVYEVDGRPMTVGELMPEALGQGPVPAAFVRRQLEAYRRWSEPALSVGCETPQDPKVPAEGLLALRLPPMLHEFVANSLSAELERFVGLHRQVMVREPDFVLNLWIMPFGEDPYRAHRALQRLLSSARAEIGEAEVAAARAAGAQLHRDLHFGTSRIDQYEPRLHTVLDTVEIGMTSPILRSPRNRAFLAVHLLSREPGRPLALDATEDRDLIVSRYLESSSDEALTLMAEHHLGNRKARNRLLDACTRALAADGAEGTTP